MPNIEGKRREDETLLLLQLPSRAPGVLFAILVPVSVYHVYLLRKEHLVWGWSDPGRGRPSAWCSGASLLWQGAPLFLAFGVSFVFVWALTFERNILFIYLF